MNDNEIQNTINSFQRWHYQFNLKGHLTPIADQTRVNRHLQRKRYFFDPLVKLLGGSLTGKRVLDLGCNAGFWSLLAIEHGCAFVLGIDGRQMHIDQAHFVFQVNQIPTERYRFLAGNIFDTDLKRFGVFDVVLYLGLMYHINKPVLLMEQITEINDDLLVIDTHLSSMAGSCLEIRREDLSDPRNAIDSELVLWPTQEAVVEIARQFGYAVAMLTPDFDDYTGAEDYLDGSRRAFWCSRRTQLPRNGLA